MDTEQKAAQVDHVVNAAHHTHQDNVQHSARNVINVTKNHFSSCCRSKNKTKEMAMVEDHPKLKAQRCHRPKSRGRCSRSRSRSRSRSNTRSAHSIKLDRKDQVQQESMVKKTFNSISRSSSASKTTETDPSGRTKIITLLNVKVPRRIQWMR